MSLWPRKRWSLGVGMQGIAWGRSGEALLHRAPAEFMPDSLPLQESSPQRVSSLRASLQGAVQAMAAQPATDVRVLLADNVVRYWLQAVPQRLGSLRELQAVAGLRCGQIFGGGTAAWHVAGDWQAQGLFVCAAVPRWIMDTVTQVMPGSLCVSSLLAQCLRSDWVTSQRDGWLCLTLPGTAVVLGLTHGRIASLRLLPLPAYQASDEVLVLDLAALELQREALRAQRPVPAQVTWLPLLRQQAGEAVVRGIQFRPVPAPAWAGQAKDIELTDDAGLAATLGLSPALWSGA